MNDWERQHRQAQRYKEAYPPGTRLMLLSILYDPLVKEVPGIITEEKMKERYEFCSFCKYNDEKGRERPPTITQTEKKYKKSPKKPCHKRIFLKIR